MEQRDEQLWKKAKERVEFKRHFFTYVLVNAFLWILWYLGSSDSLDERTFFPWPLWCTLGWGIGITFEYYGAYYENKDGMVEREYEKLKKGEGI